MRINTAKRRMLEGKPVIGAPISLGAPIVGELLSQAGFDFVLVDNQHGLWDDNGTMLAFRSICLGPAVPMARVRQNDFYAIGRLLDRGALGIVVPMVNSVEEAKAAAYAVRYPPRGGRSIGPTGAGFLGEDYVRRIDDEVFLAVQIESIQAVERAEEILAVEGVDGCWIGPADLSNSMGVDQSTSEGAAAVESAIMRVLEACRKVGKIPGIAAGRDAARWIERGFLFVTITSEIDLMMTEARRMLQELGHLT
ncbi:MAG TPA: 2-dehydro-3-deoxyglucarate aldolase [Caldilineae bacterium]|nr:2-dehydro-3-deoxyglucarate aldolase [Caldilineae bacterium]